MPVDRLCNNSFCYARQKLEKKRKCALFATLSFA